MIHSLCFVARAALHHSFRRCHRSHNSYALFNLCALFCGRTRILQKSMYKDSPNLCALLRILYCATKHPYFYTTVVFYAQTHAKYALFTPSSSAGRLATLHLSFCGRWLPHPKADCAARCNDSTLLRRQKNTNAVFSFVTTANKYKGNHAEYDKKIVVLQPFVYLIYI